MSDQPEHEMRVGFAGDHKQIRVTVPTGDLEPWDLDTQHDLVGGRHDRVDALAKVTGKARYTYDLNLPGMLHGAILRSPHPAGRVNNIKLEAARARPGVQAVIPLKRDGRNRIRFVGDPIAAIAAESLDQALDALEHISAEYELEAAVIDFRDHEQAPELDRAGQVQDPWPSEDAEAVETALAASDHQVSGTWSCEVQTHCSFESHGTVCWFKPETGSMEVWASTQASFAAVGALARAVELPRNQVVVHAEFIGGGFGSKFTPGHEGAACALLSKASGRPVKLMLSRFEEQTCAGNRPSALIQIRAGATADGTITAWDYRAYGGPGFSARGGSTHAPTSYFSKAAVRNTHRDLGTNTDAGRPMRAPGRPQGVFAAEGLLDQLATACGINPLALRLHNESEPLRAAEWRRGAELFGWAKRHNPSPGKARGDDPTKLHGAGLAGAFWGGMGGHGDATPFRVLCRIHGDGSVEIRNGAQDIGTGLKTVMATLCAEQLQLPIDRIQATMGHTTDPFGPYAGGSTSTPSLAPAVRLAADLARRELSARVAKHLGAAVEDVFWEQGRIGVVDGESMSFDQACKVLVGQAPIETSGQRFPNYEGYQDNVCGCQFAAVEVDTETGNVRV